MNALMAWLKSKPRGTLTELHERIRDEIPNVSVSLLYQYMAGIRICPYHVARLLSLETGIPLHQITFKYIHRPDPEKNLAEGK